MNCLSVKTGVVVQHFKRELADVTKNPNAYLYIINGTVINTDTDETMVIYTALYAPFKAYARPLKEFCSLVDKEKYPWIKQKERFKKYQAE